MKRWPSEASVKFLVKLFSKSLRLVRRSLTPLPLWRAAHEEKLGKQGLCPAFPGRWGSCPLSHGCRRASSPKGGAKSRLPLWGRCPRRGRRGLREAIFSVRYRPGKKKRFAVSLAFFLAAAHKGKVVGRCPTPRNPLKRVDLNFTWLPAGLYHSSSFPPHLQGPGGI